MQIFWLNDYALSRNIRNNFKCLLSQLATVEIFNSISVNLPERKQKRIVRTRSEITDVTLLNYLSVTPSLLLLCCQKKSARNCSHKTKPIDGTSALSTICPNNGRKTICYAKSPLCKGSDCSGDKLDIYGIVLYQYIH